MSAPFTTSFDKTAPNTLETLRHSAAHIMARAVMRLFPDVQLAFGPAPGRVFRYCAEFIT